MSLLLDRYARGIVVCSFSSFLAGKLAEECERLLDIFFVPGTLAPSLERARLFTALSSSALLAFARYEPPSGSCLQHRLICALPRAVCCPTFSSMTARSFSLSPPSRLSAVKSSLEEIAERLHARLHLHLLCGHFCVSGNDRHQSAFRMQGSSEEWIHETHQRTHR